MRPEHEQKARAAYADIDDEQDGYKAIDIIARALAEAEQHGRAGAYHDVDMQLRRAAGAAQHRGIAAMLRKFAAIFGDLSSEMGAPTPEPAENGDSDDE